MSGSDISSFFFILFFSFFFFLRSSNIFMVTDCFLPDIGSDNR